MKIINNKKLRSLVSEYTEPSTHTALIILMVDMTIYLSSIAGVLFLENTVIRILCGVLAGLKMASMFVIAHDAAHDSYTSSKLLNKIIGRLAFLPCYHNYSLWLIAHNRLHHQSTNVKDVNSWSPLSKEEYDELPVWRQKVERFYRSIPGISFNYLIERWWKDKFYPYKRLAGEFKLSYWLDFILVSSFLIGQISLFSYTGIISANGSALGSVMLGVVIPLMVSSFMVGFSVYQQHTHETIPWFKTRDERDRHGNIEDVTVHVQYPQWYNLISHNVMEHTAHHVDPRVPLYKLAKAQQQLVNYIGDTMVSMKFSPRSFITTMEKCKLYDYENHCWLGFDGIPSSGNTLYLQEYSLAQAA